MGGHGRHEGERETQPRGQPGNGPSLWTQEPTLHQALGKRGCGNIFLARTTTDKAGEEEGGQQAAENILVSRLKTH